MIETTDPFEQPIVKRDYLSETIELEIPVENAVTPIPYAYSVHKIFDRDNLPFSAIDYSRFKFGDKDIAREYGYRLAIGVMSQKFCKEPSNQYVVISSPYCFIPTATFAMKDYFVQTMNKMLVKRGEKPVQETKIHRVSSYKEDYGNLDVEARMAIMDKDCFHIDKEFTKGKVLLFLDDVRITGSHEKRIKDMIEQYKITNQCAFIYWAELANKKIHPNVENDLNYAFVKSLLDLDKILKNNNFLINTRVVKYILNAPFSEFKTFIHYQPLRFVNNVYSAAIGNSYHEIPEYAKNLSYIQTMIS